MKRQRSVFTVLLFVLILNCSPAIRSLPPEEREKITTRVYQTDYRKLFNALMVVTEEAGYTISEANMRSGIINTDIYYSTALFTDGVRKKLNLRI